MATASSAGFVTETTFDWSLIAYFSVASLWSWDQAISGSVVVVWVKFEALRTIDALISVSWILIIATATGSTGVVAFAVFNRSCVVIVVLIAFLDSSDSAVSGSI